MESLMAWAAPAYRFAAETAAELAILAWRGLRLAFRAALALLLFLPWLAVQGVKRLRKTGKDGDG